MMNVLRAVVLFSQLTLAFSMAQSIPFYIGTYTGGESEGIYHSTLDLESGKCSPATLAAKTANPSFLAIHPDKKHVYAVNEVSEYEGQATGSVSAFEIQSEGKLKFLNDQSSHGTAPCHLSIDATGNYVLVANYGAGSVASLPIVEEGKLGDAASTVQHEGASVNRNRQQAPHAHSINLHPENKHAFAADLGLDKVLVYAFDTNTGSLGEKAIAAGVLKPGAGPRHSAVRGDRLYVINELDSTITLFQFSSDDGSLTPIQTISTLPPGYRGRSHTAEIQVSPDGRHVYGSNRGHDSIAVFRVSEPRGELTLIEIEPTQGKTPRNFALDPSGAFLLAENQNSDTITVFRIDGKTGELHPTAHELSVPNPVCVRFLP